MANETICILGDNLCAWKIAANLMDAGKRVIVAADRRPRAPQRTVDCKNETGSLETLFGVRLAECSGGPGRFELTFEGSGETLRRAASVVIASESEERRPTFAFHGLKPSPFVTTLSDLPAVSPGFSHVVFLNGVAGESHPRVAGEVMRAAHRLQVERRVQTYILTGNLKVAGDGLEALSREARSAGVLFFKFTSTRPEVRQSPEGRVQITFVDELAGNSLNLAPDLVVVDETIAPSASAIELGRVLGIESDGAGFIQGDNVHRLTVATNRRGIIVAGAARSAGSEPDIEASNAALAALAALSPAEDAQRVEIEAGNCIRCLTCLRVCPYHAVSLNTRPRIDAAACETCGICAAECPREAIRIPGLEGHELLARVTAGRPPDRTDGPYIAAFCCRRSAGVAARGALCERRGWDATINIIEVPCAGSLPPGLLLSTFGRGAEGVLVLTCHEDNCHSRQGNRFARMRAEQVAAFLKSSGVPEQRFMFRTLAANMVREFTDIAAGFSSAVRGLGHGKPT